MKTKLKIHWNTVFENSNEIMAKISADYGLDFQQINDAIKSYVFPEFATEEEWESEFSKFEKRCIKIAEKIALSQTK